MAKKQYSTHINAGGQEIEVRYGGLRGDYISLTDMAKYRNAEATGLVISHWLSTRYAIEYLGIWERVNNPEFNRWSSESRGQARLDYAESRQRKPKVILRNSVTLKTMPEQTGLFLPVSNRNQ